MIDTYALMRDGFTVKDGRLCNRNGDFLNIFVTEGQAWGGDPFYIFSDYQLSDYKIERVKEFFAGEHWYLMRGYEKLCELRHLGGINFETI